MIELIEGLPEGVVGLEASAEVESGDQTGPSAQRRDRRCATEDGSRQRLVGAGSLSDDAHSGGIRCQLTATSTSRQKEPLT